jgi:hypothetical protein
MLGYRAIKEVTKEAEGNNRDSEVSVRYDLEHSLRSPIGKECASRERDFIAWNRLEMISGFVRWC